jgi:hypothetical protein
MDTELFTWKTHSNTLRDLQHGISIAQNSGAKSLLVLTCSQNAYPEQPLNFILKNCSIPIFGGIYPMISHQETLIKQGALIIGFKENYDVTIFSDLQHLKNEDTLESLINTTLEAKKNLSGQDDFLMFYDALINNVEDFIDCLFECLDHGITIAGGGAGNLDFIQRPCLFTNKGLLANAVLLVNLPSKLTTGVAHGWTKIEGPLLVSEAHGQIVQSLNYRPAFEVYSHIIERASDHEFKDGDFFDIAKNFPLGIEDINNNLIVRDPISTANNNLQLIGNIPVNSMVYILGGETNSLLLSSEKAAINVFSTPTKNTTRISMVFDCISRVVFMEDEFDKELQIINKYCPSPTLFGVLSIGEIANSESSAIRLLNKSTVICSW